MKSTLITLGALGAVAICFVIYIFVSSLITGPAPSPIQSAITSQIAFPSTQAISAPSPQAPDEHPTATSTPTRPLDDKIAAILKQTYPLVTAGKLDDALAVINPAIEANPTEPNLYSARAFIYAQQSKYDLERQDLNKALELGDKGSVVKFDLAEIDFVQKNYDVARPAFLALESDADKGDLAAYKVFLCDLFGGHDEQAAKELNDFNIAGSNASYYFANIASNLYHHKPEAAQPYLDSANRIYSPVKVEIYSTSLKNLGYLPIPAPASAN